MKTHTYSILIVLMFLAGRSPRVMTKVVFHKAPLPDSVKVDTVYRSEDAPDQLEILARLSIYDVGFSTNCDLPGVLSFTEQEARKVGGNGLYIYDHFFA